MCDWVLADTASWELHSHPLITDNRMDDTRVVECTLALSALNIGETVPVYTAFDVAHVFVLFLALGTVSITFLKREMTGQEVLLTIIAHIACSWGFIWQ